MFDYEYRISQFADDSNNFKRFPEHVGYVSSVHVMRKAQNPFLIKSEVKHLGLSISKDSNKR